jgi:hypothetical protein
MLPDKITEAKTRDQCLAVLADYIPADVYQNCYSAFMGIIIRAHEIGYCEGKEYQKEILRIQLGLNPTKY